MFVNIDESAIHSEVRFSTTTHSEVSISVPHYCSEINVRRLTVCVSVAEYGTNLSLFYIFKEAADVKIENN